MMKIPRTFCQICGQDSHGQHFGVRSCRACAAFFRRYAHSKWVIAKCTKKHVNGGVCFCRPCRLQTCLKMGMDTTKFQYDRDTLSMTSKNPPLLHTPSSFFGRPEFLMYCDPQYSNAKVFIDIQHLLSEASRLLDSGCETPINANHLNQLEKLNLGASFLRLDTSDIKFYGSFGKVEFIDIIEYYFVTVIKWILRFDEFQILNRGTQMTLVNSIWHVFMKFHKCSATAMFRKANENARPHQKVLRNVCMDQDKAQLDTSWISDYPHEYIGLYMRSQNIHESEAIEEIGKLNPTDVELTFMFAQTCFEYAGKRFQGEIMQITDRFQQILSNDLHVYYTEEERNPRYLKRLAELMKVNNIIQRSIWEGRPQRELGRVFNVIKIGFSHPQMFEDCAFCSSV